MLAFSSALERFLSLAFYSQVVDSLMIHKGWSSFSESYSKKKKKVAEKAKARSGLSLYRKNTIHAETQKDPIPILFNAIKFSLSLLN